MYLLRVLKKLIEKDEEYRLVCVGSGDLFNRVSQTAQQMGVSKYVIFTGQRKDTYALLSAMDVFVFPSIHEALPITLIEAQANGLPCVISDYVTSEIDVLDTITRLSINTKAEKWAEAINLSYDRRKYTVDSSGFGDFNISTMKERLRTIYEKVVK